MILLFKLIFKNLYRFITDKNQRTFYRLAFQFGNRKIKKTTVAKFKNHKIQISNGESFVWQFKEIFTDEIYKFETQSQKPVIYDCGANIGMSILFFHKNYPNAIIKAFEAHPKVADILKNNINENKIKAELIAKAVWIHNEGIEISNEGIDNSSIFGKAKKIKIESLRLHELLKKETKIDMLKIDIEGAELEVLKDCENQLYKINNIFVEYHSFNNSEQKLSELLSIFERQKFRYNIYNIRELKKSPFLNTEKEKKDMDLQLNIFAKKITRAHVQQNSKTSKINQ